jgi:glycerophosphoryl diester phosphodiesterase
MRRSPAAPPGRALLSAAVSAAFEFLDHPGPIPYAHRGGGGERAENSMAAFANAVALGFRYLETDARLTADGKLVAIHDDRLDRVSDRTGLVAELTYDEVRQARLWGPGRAELTEERVPLLEEVFSTWPEARINVDAKEDRAVGPLADLVGRTGSLARVCVGAFSDKRARELRRRLGPGLCSVLGPLEVAAIRVASFGLPLVGVHGAVAQVPLRRRVAPFVEVPIVDRRFVARATRAGVATHVWTIDEADEMRRLLDLGVTGLISDRPTVLKQVLTDRGQWPG